MAAKPGAMENRQINYIRRFFNVERVIGKGAFGQVLVTSPIQNQQQLSPIITTAANIQAQSPTPPDSISANSMSSSIVSCNNASFITTKTSSPTSTGFIYRPESSHESSSDQPGTLNGKALGKVGSSGNSSKGKYTRYAIKCILPVIRPFKLASELRYLRDLGGQCNVVQLYTAQLHQGSLYIVMDMIEPDRFENIVCSSSYQEIVTYIKKLLEALKHVHSRNIMHRDIKPLNFLHNRSQGKYLLVDFGLAAQVRTRPTVKGSSDANVANGTPITGNLPSNESVPPTTPTRRSLNSGMSSSIVTTPTSIMPSARQPIANRHLVGSNLFAADAEHQRSKIITDSPYVNPARITSPTKRSFCSPLVHNVSTKRNYGANDTADSIQMFKRLRVTNTEEAKEPVKLTVGAYESPVTANEALPRSARQLNNNNQDNDHTFSTPKQPPPRCFCRNKPRTCPTCMSRPESPASRSGTASYKAPEVLLHYPFQNSAIDVWAAGVMLFCLLAGHTPLFRDRDDATLVAEIITILGSHAVKEAARQMNIRLTLPQDRQGFDLKRLCQSVRAKSANTRHDVEIPDEAYDLLKRMLDPNPNTRITASDALNHPWLCGDD